MRHLNLLSVWWLKAVPMHPYQAKPHPKTHPGNETWAPCVPNPSLGNKKLKLDPVFTQHFFHYTGHAEQLLSYSSGTICYLKVNPKVFSFQYSMHIQAKNSSHLWNSAQSCLPSVVFFIAQGWELGPAGEVFAFKRGCSKIQRKQILYCCLPLCFN